MMVKKRWIGLFPGNLKFCTICDQVFSASTGSSFNIENMLQEKFLGSWRSDRASVIELSLHSNYTDAKYMPLGILYKLALDRGFPLFSYFN